MAAFKTQKEKMDDQRSYLVVKDNALIQKAKYNLTANEQKLVNYVITMIKPGEEEFKKYEIVPWISHVSAASIRRTYTVISET